MKTLFITPSPPDSFEAPFPVLPLGIACLAAVSVSHGAETRALWGRDYQIQLQDYLHRHKPDLVGFQTFINNIHQTITSAKLIKSLYPDTIIVCGGVQASNFPEKILQNNSIDCVISGEAEMIFHHLIENLKQLSKVPGLIWRKGDQIRKNPGGYLEENLDNLPPIPYELFYPQTDKLPIGHLLTHRGCPHHCSHCPLKFRAGVPIRAHSAERINTTIDLLIDQYGAQSIEFYDENFTMHQDLVRQLCVHLENKTIPWMCTARISELDVNLAETMARSGCQQIIFGLGSGVERVQKILGTNEDLKVAIDILRKLTDMGIHTVAAFSLGVPTETKYELSQTIDYALNLPVAEIRFEPSAPLPGTILYETAQSGGRFILNDWENYKRPGQMIYLPANRYLFEFSTQIRYAKFRAKLKSLFHTHFRRSHGKQETTEKIQDAN